MNPELNEHQKNAVRGLHEIKICLEKNNIDFFLLAGSCLGGVREKGMILWDDDIDIGIFVKDKERVAEILSSSLPKPYRWVDWNNSDKYSRPHGKLLYNDIECVDVFTLVKTSDNAFFRRVHWINRLVFFKLYRSKVNYVSKHETQNLINKIKLLIARFLSLFFSKKWLKRRINDIENKYENSDKNLYFINFYSVYGLNKEMINREWLFPKSTVTFEGELYPTVGDTHNYLSHLYGDYMTPKKNNNIHMERF